MSSLCTNYCTIYKTLRFTITMYVGYSEIKERFAIKKYVLIIGKKTNMHVVAHTFTNISI
jgi:hypothetical protein